MYQIIGIESTYFKDKETHQEFHGTRLHCTYEKENVDGLCVESFYCNSRVDVDGLKLGDHCEIFYNKYGKVSHIKVVG